jgi:hypothetical protein
MHIISTVIILLLDTGSEDGLFLFLRQHASLTIKYVNFSLNSSLFPNVKPIKSVFQHRR